MYNNFQFKSQELPMTLNQVKGFITGCNPTIGIVNEEILKSFLKEYLQKK